MHAPLKLDDIPTERHRYDEIRNLCMGQLTFVLTEDATMEATRARIDEEIDSFYQGNLEHAAEVLSALWEIVNRGGNTTGPPSVSPPQAVSRFRFRPLGALCGGCLLLHVFRSLRPQAPPTGLL